jgi:hypothetical protein
MRRDLVRRCSWLALTGLLLSLVAGGAWQFRGLLLDNNLHAVRPGQVYRSGRHRPEELACRIEELHLKAVIDLQGGPERADVLAHQRQVCHQRGVEFHAVHWHEDALPYPAELRKFISLVDTCPQPMLIQGRYGIDRSGLAAAIVELLGGRSPSVARRQFEASYGCFDRTAYGGAQVIQAYERWLAHHSERNVLRPGADGTRSMPATLRPATWNGVPHSPERFRRWVRRHYDPDRIISFSSSGSTTRLPSSPPNIARLTSTPK